MSEHHKQAEASTCWFPVAAVRPPACRSFPGTFDMDSPCAPSPSRELDEPSPSEQPQEIASCSLREPKAPHIVRALLFVESVEIEDLGRF